MVIQCFLQEIKKQPTEKCLLTQSSLPTSCLPSHPQPTPLQGLRYYYSTAHDRQAGWGPVSSTISSSCLNYLLMMWALPGYPHPLVLGAWADGNSSYRMSLDTAVHWSPYGLFTLKSASCFTRVSGSLGRRKCVAKLPVMMDHVPRSYGGRFSRRPSASDPRCIDQWQEK